MISNSFVPTSGMPGWLQLIAAWNPISPLVEARRELFGNPAAISGSSSFPLQHPIAVTIGWSLLLLDVFIPLATRRYQTAGRSARGA
jgi:ABC-2 type transport system permease protein